MYTYKKLGVPTTTIWIEDKYMNRSETQKCLRERPKEKGRPKNSEQELRLIFAEKSALWENWNQDYPIVMPTYNV